MSPVEGDFGVWLAAQVARADAIGDLARDYIRAVRESAHVAIATPEELADILGGWPASTNARAAFIRAVAEWSLAAAE